MAYDKHTWTCDEPITVERLNHIENGIANAGGDCDCGYECTETEVTFFNGSITTTDIGDYAEGTFTPSQAMNTDTLTVTMDGTEYVLPKIDADGSYGELNNESPSFTNFPCFIDPVYERFETRNAGTFTVKMEGAIESVTATECFGKAVKLFTLKHLLDGEADGSLRSNTSTPEGSGYTLGEGAVALGDSTEASGDASHAEGSTTVASGDASHAEGSTTVASGYVSHAEGRSSVASEDAAHAEGTATVASRVDSHAEGRSSVASGINSHAQNEHTIAQGKDQTTIGRYNVAQGTANSIAATDYAFIIGNGSSNTNRKNAFAIKWDGTFVFADGTEITPAQFAALKALLQSNTTNKLPTP